MPKLKQLAFLLVFALPFVACKKDKQRSTDCTLSEASLMGTYTYGAVTYKATPNSSAIDASSMVDACSLDDQVTFSTNHVFTAELDSGTIQNFTCNAFTIASPDVFNTGDTLLITFKRK